MFNSLKEECNNLWYEISENRYNWEWYQDEAVYLQSVNKESVISAFYEWLLPNSASTENGKRRCLVVHVIGTSEGAASNERPLFGLDVLDIELVEEIRAFHISANNGT